MNRLILVLFIGLFLFTTKTYSQEWTQTGSTPHGAGVSDMVVMNDGTLIVTTASYNWPSGQHGGIRRSTDEGNSWQNVINCYNARTLYLGSSGKLFASCWLYPENEGMFFSTNGGLNWQQTYFGAANDNVFSIAAKNGDSMVFIGTRNGIFRQFNNGTWLQINFGLPANSWVRDLSISPEGFILAATTNGVFRSTNQGNAWIPSGSGLPSGDTIVSLSKFTGEGDVYCASSSGRAYKTNSGSFGWAQIFDQRDGEPISKVDIGPLLDPQISQLRLILIGHYVGLYNLSYSTNQGNTWVGTSLGITGPVPISSFASRLIAKARCKIFATLYLGTLFGAKIFSSELKVSVGINQITLEIPDSYSLAQNYPNPFNPVTKINFEIPKPSHVKIVIYDQLGREVETLVNENLTAGAFETDWNASAFNSGVYFYKLVTDNFTETKKMLLIK